jgi:hypothetical protein
MSRAYAVFGVVGRACGGVEGEVAVATTVVVSRAHPAMAAAAAVMPAVSNALRAGKTPFIGHLPSSVE